MVESAIYRLLVPEIGKFPSQARRRAWRSMFGSSDVFVPWWAFTMLGMAGSGACIGFSGYLSRASPLSLYAILATMFCTLHLVFIALWRRKLSKKLAVMLEIRGLCAACGYNLTGNTSGVCSECGTPIAAPKAATNAAPEKQA